MRRRMLLLLPYLSTGDSGRREARAPLPEPCEPRLLLVLAALPSLLHAVWWWRWWWWCW